MTLSSTIADMLKTKAFAGRLPEPIPVLEKCFKEGGITLLHATFENSFFVDPERVRARTPYFPDRARLSRTHYSGALRGDHASWKGRKVRLGDNSRAQLAWGKYAQRGVARGSGYGVRHIWGRPWDPDAFTAGWNLCYMPFWAGMLTEEQHPHELIETAVRQASWDLYFRDNPVCRVPTWVSNPGLDLKKHLGHRPLLLLAPERESAATIASIRAEKNQSWKSLSKAVRALLRRPFEPFDSKNVEANSKSVVRRMMRETGLSLEELKNHFDARG